MIIVEIAVINNLVLKILFIDKLQIIQGDLQSYRAGACRKPQNKLPLSGLWLTGYRVLKLKK